MAHLSRATFMRDVIVNLRAQKFREKHSWSSAPSVISHLGRGRSAEYPAGVRCAQDRRSSGGLLAMSLFVRRRSCGSLREQSALITASSMSSLDSVSTRSGSESIKRPRQGTPIVSVRRLESDAGSADAGARLRGCASRFAGCTVAPVAARMGTAGRTSAFLTAVNIAWPGRWEHTSWFSAKLRRTYG